MQDDFYMINIGEMELVLGLQWLHSLKEYTQNYQTMELKFKSKGKEVVQHGLSNGGPMMVLTKRMERYFRRGEVAWATKFLIIDISPPKYGRSYHVDIQSILDKQGKVFNEIPPGLPPNRGLQHVIELDEGAKPVITMPYGHPRRYKEEMKRQLNNYWTWGTYILVLAHLPHP